MSADDVTPGGGFPWSGMLRVWLFGDVEDELAAVEVPALEAPEAASAPADELEVDADIVIADLRDELAARAAEIAALRSQVVRPGYDPALGAVVGARGKGGRPRVVTPDVQALLLKLLRQGVTRAVACTRARISKPSLTHAMRADPVFKADVQRAELASIEAAEKSFARHAKGKDWRASESFLKRRLPDVWALPSERILAPNVAEHRAIKEEVLAALVTSLVGPVAPGEKTHATAPTEDAEADDDAGLP